MEVLYRAEAEIKGGREGQARVLDHPAAFCLAFPIELGGAGGGANPEQLLAVAYGASFGSALDLEARQLRLELAEIFVTAAVALGHGDDGGYALSVELQIRLPGLDAPTAERLLRAAREACPYCRMARGNIELRLVLA